MESYNTSSILTLISHIHSCAAEFLQKKLTASGFQGMSSSHGNIIFRLSLYDKLPMTELSRQVNRDKSTVTVLVNKLLKNGLVERTQSETDSRVNYISLTKKGKEYTAKTDIISKELLETCYQGFSEEEKETITALLNRISDNFS